ncbi:hypothetical protein TSUD_110550 [Trifolium subterraneum]|uniref:Uncharacterized protein n=1 Tax=Trifolium subterraneum TaxID=3900 RepID=A0A2Z6MGW1_TRISU|nr:hypothetical protein TSUD_110550 [Trifolium subterraneum]
MLGLIISHMNSYLDNYVRIDLWDSRQHGQCLQNKGRRSSPKKWRDNVSRVWMFTAPLPMNTTLERIPFPKQDMVNT